ncbi:Legionaminic acid biosynthesis protein PtmG [Nitrospina watsonii]|uniref:Legionaminic acid biosynthesis protein PtmG n=1 Tax=Nitrospina watsonii TaxID=1323948 RepID=A0ABM9HA34_9BACT|nr:Legionaminic acid biosynthesis protein PtmG [Nitrospina watsonii]
MNQPSIQLFCGLTPRASMPLFIRLIRFVLSACQERRGKNRNRPGEPKASKQGTINWEEREHELRDLCDRFRSKERSRTRSPL